MSKELFQVINLFDWTGGIRDNRQNPLAFPHQALMSGENVDLVDMGLKTRCGTVSAPLAAHRMQRPASALC